MCHIYCTLRKFYDFTRIFKVVLECANRDVTSCPFKWEKKPVNIAIMRSFKERFETFIISWSYDVRKPQNWSFQKFWWRHENQNLKIHKKSTKIVLEFFNMAHSLCISSIFSNFHANMRFFPINVPHLKDWIFFLTNKIHSKIYNPEKQLEFRWVDETNQHSSFSEMQGTRCTGCAGNMMALLAKSRCHDVCAQLNMCVCTVPRWFAGHITAGTRHFC
jgi:hypothetical protein